MTHIKPNNISIIFTAYNILEYVQLAVYSFLHFYPEFKKSIIVFDDESNDGTKEWLEQEGLQRITWKNKDNFLVKFSNLKKIFSEHTGINASYRNSVMIHEIFKQIDTKYIMINDADVLFLKGDWLEKYDKMLPNVRVFAPIEKYCYEWSFQKNPFFNKFKNKFLGKYETLYNNNNKMERLHFFHSLIDLEYIKDRELLFDHIHNKKFIELIYNNAILDTGSDFSWEIWNQNVPHYVIPDNLVYNRWSTTIEKYMPCLERDLKDAYIYHFRWISSYRRFLDDYGETEINKHTFKKIKMDFKANSILYNQVKYIHEKYNTKFPSECL